MASGIMSSHGKPSKYNLWRDPNYYVLLDYFALDAEQFQIPSSCGENFFLILFQAGGIESPESEPICVYHYAGMRRFLWRDAFYSEYPLDYRDAMTRAMQLMRHEPSLDKALGYRKVLDWLRVYGLSQAPPVEGNTDTMLTDPELRNRKFVRAIYEIP